MSVAEIITSRKFVYILAVVIISLLFNPFYEIPIGTRGIITQFGAVHSVVSEGIVFIPPWKRMVIFNMRAKTVLVENAEGITNDAQQVRISLAVSYSLAPNRLTEIYKKYSYNGDLSSYVEYATQDIFKTVTAEYSASDLMSQRSQFVEDLSSRLQIKLNLYGAIIINLDTRNFSLPDVWPDQSKICTKKDVVGS